MKASVHCVAIASVLTLGLTACGTTDDSSGTPASTSSSSSLPMASSTAAVPTASATATASSITIKDFVFEFPASVSPGARVIIKNLDAQAHTVTSKKGGFDVKVDPGGTAALVAPNAPGSYPVVCSFHANMSATLVVK